MDQKQRKAAEAAGRKRTEQIELTNLCLLEDGDRILVEDRVDPHWHGLCLPGGHVEPGESFQSAVIREMREETGLTVEQPRLCGIKQFPYPEGGRYLVLLYKAERYSGELKSSEEGRVFWIRRSELKNHEQTPDFETLLRVFDEDGLNEFYYEGNTPVLF